MTEQKPTAGRIVQYTISEGDEEFLASKFGDEFSRTLNKPHAGDVYPALIVRVWAGTCVNLKVQLDGEPVFWATSRMWDNPEDIGTRYLPDPNHEGPGHRGGTWHWPARG
jgi:hypothetical protein